MNIASSGTTCHADGNSSDWYCITCDREIPCLFKDVHISAPTHQSNLKNQQLSAPAGHRSQSTIPEVSTEPHGQKPGALASSDTIRATITSASSDRDTTSIIAENNEDAVDASPSVVEASKDKTGSKLPLLVRPPSHPAGPSRLDEHVLPTNSLNRRKYNTTPHSSKHRAWDCTICEKTMHEGSRDAHLAGAKHRAKETKLVGGPAVMWYCDVCDGSFSVTGKRQHLNEKKHQANTVLHRRKQTVLEVRRDIRVDRNEATTNSNHHAGEKVVHVVPGEYKRAAERMMGVMGVTAGYEINQGRLAEAIGKKSMPLTRPEGSVVANVTAGGSCTAPEANGGVIYCEICAGSSQRSQRRIRSTPPWTCAVCEKTFHLACRASHLCGDEHFDMLRSKGFGIRGMGS